MRKLKIGPLLNNHVDNYIKKISLPLKIKKDITQLEMKNNNWTEKIDTNKQHIHASHK